MKTAGMFDPPSAMVDEITDWSIAQVAAKKIAELQQERRTQRKEIKEMLASPMVAKFKGTISDMKAVLPAGKTRQLYQTYMAFYEQTTSMFGYAVSRLGMKDFSKVDDRRMQIVKMVERQIESAEEYFEERATMKRWFANKAREIKELKRHTKSGVKAFKGNEVERVFSIDLTDWYIDEAKVEEARSHDLEKYEALKDQGYPRDMLQTIIDNTGAKWRTIKVSLMIDLKVSHASAYWSPSKGLVAIKIPWGTDPARLGRQLRNSIEHELRHFGQTLMSEVLGIGSPWFSKREPQPGMPSRKILTPEFKQRGAPAKGERDRQRPGVPSRQQQHHLDDVEFYTDLAGAIDRIKLEIRHMNMKREEYSQGPLSPADMKLVFSRMVGHKVPRKDSDRLYLTYKDPSSFFIALQRFAPGKWRKAVSEAFKEIFGSPAERVAQAWMLGRIQEWCS
jgi:hypothetical protein